MKERIDITIALVSIVTTCVLVSAGCTPFPGYIIFDGGASVMQPGFYLYRAPHFQEPLGIGGLTVWKVSRSVDQKKRGAVDAPWEIGAIAWQGRQTVWDLQYKSPDTFIKKLLRRGSTPPVSRLTYGEVPPGYQEKVKVLPLEPEEFYGVWIRGVGGELSKDTYFIIRLDASGTPERLEYHQENFLITHPNSFTHPRDDLQLE